MASEAGLARAPAAGFFGVQASHTLGDLYQAALEGVLYNVYQCYERLVQVVPVQSINLSGGILYSLHWRQMAADLFQRDLLVPESEQASLLGGAVLGQMILGGSPAADEMAFRQQLVIKPDPRRASYYQHNYQRYLATYFNPAPQTRSLLLDGLFPRLP
jgi:gluconokinase